MTTGVFPVLSSIEQVFYDLIWHPLIVGGETWLETNVPLLNLPVLKEVDEEILQLMSESLFHNFIQLIDVTAIELIEPLQQAAYAKAAENLSVVLTEKGISSAEYQTARTAALAAMAAVTHFHGM